MGRAGERVHAAADAGHPRHPAPRGVARALADSDARWRRIRRPRRSGSGRTSGYPRRALWLHRAAVEIRDRHAGVVPRDVDALLALTGIGDYTARAVAVFAYGDRHPVVDTNTRRVLARAIDGRSQPGPPSRRDLAAMERGAARGRRRRGDRQRGRRWSSARPCARRAHRGATPARSPHALRVARGRLPRHRRRTAPPGALRGQRPSGTRCGAEGAAGCRGPAAPLDRRGRGLAGCAPARPRDRPRSPTTGSSS